MLRIKVEVPSNVPAYIGELTITNVTWPPGTETTYKLELDGGGLGHREAILKAEEPSAWRLIEKALTRLCGTDSVLPRAHTAIGHPMRVSVDYEPKEPSGIDGSRRWLVVLECGHRIVVSKRRSTYCCWQCPIEMDVAP